MVCAVLLFADRNELAELLLQMIQLVVSDKLTWYIVIYYSRASTFSHYVVLYLSILLILKRVISILSNSDLSSPQ